jgi:hypothetical protein
MLAFVPSTFFLFPELGRWHPYNVPYEHMFCAANNPSANIGLINFTALQGLLHG